LRRFVFKLGLKPLGAERAVVAFRRFFGRPAPARLAAVEGVTPGDFAVACGSFVTGQPLTRRTS